MILYLDTSSLIKLYIEESGTEETADLDEDWPRYLAIEVTREIWKAAGDLAEKHALRGFDSLHLASFLHLAHSDLGEPAQFSSFDERLNDAAQAPREQVKDAHPPAPAGPSGAR